jgi:hypothetical protein
MKSCIIMGEEENGLLDYAAANLVGKKAKQRL